MCLDKDKSLSASLLTTNYRISRVSLLFSLFFLFFLPVHSRDGLHNKKGLHTVSPEGPRPTPMSITHSKKVFLIFQISDSAKDEKKTCYPRAILFIQIKSIIGYLIASLKNLSLEIDLI